MDEDDLDTAVDVLVVVDQASHLVDEFDDRLGTDVARSGLGAEDEDALRDVEGRVVLETEVQIQHVEGVEQLALVLVQTLDLNVEDGIRIDLDAFALGHPGREVDLVGVLDLIDAVVDRVVHGIGVVGEHREVLDPGVGPGDLGQQGCQTRVALVEPATRRDAVGLVVEPLRPDRVPLLEGLALDDLGVQGCDAVDRVGGVTGDPRHSHLIARDGSHVLDGLAVEAALAHVLTEATIDLADDLGDAREDAIEDLHLPPLQGFSQHGVVGVSEGVGDDLPGLVPAHAVLIEQDAHELGDGQHRMGVVELDRVVLGEVGEVLAVVLDVIVNDLLQGGRAEEVLLTDPQHLALEGGVVGVQHTGDVGGALPLDDGVGEALGAEGLVVELLHRLGLPQPQGSDVASSVTGDRHVVGDGTHPHVGVADDALLLLAADDEGVALLHPRVRVLGLETVVEELLEQAVTVEDAVAGDG